MHFDTSVLSVCLTFFPSFFRWRSSSSSLLPPLLEGLICFFCESLLFSRVHSQVLRVVGCGVRYGSSKAGRSGLGFSTQRDSPVGCPLFRSLPWPVPVKLSPPTTPHSPRRWSPSRTIASALVNMGTHAHGQHPAYRKPILARRPSASAIHPSFICSQ
ncbi:hypothetical protein B0H11DRAFT_1264398 [Mycena galericulata]|nr:hypothetical protein B0H11DRAFT_1264398 [Mycena galericulata]